MTIKMMRTMRNQVIVILMMTVPLMMICTSNKCDYSVNTICKTLKESLPDDQNYYSVKIIFFSGGIDEDGYLRPGMPKEAQKTKDGRRSWNQKIRSRKHRWRVTKCKYGYL